MAGTLGAKRELAEHVGDRRILLALDNFEQVVAAAPDLSTLVSKCPNLRLLVTSREPLHVAGEREFPVPTLTEGEAVQLFCERAEAVRPGFAADGEIAEICERLDRLPLAIELAAARVKVLEPSELLSRLEHRLPLLTGRARDVPRHQRTLRGTIEWSYELLDPDDQLLFSRLSVFSGERPTRPPLRSARRRLTASSRSWTRASFDTCRADSRCSRRFGSTRSTARTEWRRGRPTTMSCRVLLRVLRARRRELEGPDQAAWFDAIALDHDNVRAALEWSFSGGDHELGTRLASSLGRFWLVRGHLIEGQRWLDRALATTSERPLWLETKLLRVAAGNANELHDVQRLGS